MSDNAHCFGGPQPVLAKELLDAVNARRADLGTGGTASAPRSRLRGAFPNQILDCLEEGPRLERIRDMADCARALDRLTVRLSARKRPPRCATVALAQK